MAWPKYAEGYKYQKHLLVTFFCKQKCHITRYGLVSKQPWESAGMAGDPELFVTCLKCRGSQHDSYNWKRLQ